MSDKSPRQHMAKKQGKTIKEKRADKKANASAAAMGDPWLEPRNASSGPGLTPAIGATSVGRSGKALLSTAHGRPRRNDRGLSVVMAACSGL